MRTFDWKYDDLNDVLLTAIGADKCWERLKGRIFFKKAVHGVELEDGPSKSNPWTSLDIETGDEE